MTHVGPPKGARLALVGENISQLGGFGAVQRALLTRPTHLYIEPRRLAEVWPGESQAAVRRNRLSLDPPTASGNEPWFAEGVDGGMTAEVGA